MILQQKFKIFFGPYLMQFDKNCNCFRSIISEEMKYNVKSHSLVLNKGVFDVLVFGQKHKKNYQIVKKTIFWGVFDVNLLTAAG